MSDRSLAILALIALVVAILVRRFVPRPQNWLLAPRGRILKHMTH